MIRGKSPTLCNEHPLPSGARRRSFWDQRGRTCSPTCDSYKPLHPSLRVYRNKNLSYSRKNLVPDTFEHSVSRCYKTTSSARQYYKLTKAPSTLHVAGLWNTGVHRCTPRASCAIRASHNQWVYFLRNSKSDKEGPAMIFASSPRKSFITFTVRMTGSSSVSA